MIFEHEKIDVSHLILGTLTIKSDKMKGWGVNLDPSALIYKKVYVRSFSVARDTIGKFFRVKVYFFAISPPDPGYLQL